MILMEQLAVQRVFLRPPTLGQHREREAIMAQNNQQGGNQPNQNPGQDGQQEQQDQTRRQPNPDQGGNQAGGDDGNRQNR
jgi:hypothetical protein